MKDFSACQATYFWLVFRRIFMFDSTDADYETAQKLYRRCAYEALLALRQEKPASEVSKWVNLGEAVADLWQDSDVIIVEDEPEPAPVSNT